MCVYHNGVKTKNAVTKLSTVSTCPVVPHTSSYISVLENTPVTEAC